METKREKFVRLAEKRMDTVFYLDEKRNCVCLYLAGIFMDTAW